MYQSKPATATYLGFVIGHDQPAIVQQGARYWRAHEDGTPMVATGADDTLAACEARHAKSKTAKRATSSKSKASK